MNVTACFINESRVLIALASSFGFKAKATAPVITTAAAVASNKLDDEPPPPPPLSLLDWGIVFSISGILGGSIASVSSSTSSSSSSSSSSPSSSS